MKIVNKSNIPKSVFQFLEMDFYDGVRKDGYFSITELLKPIQEIVLTRRHYSQIEVDAIDRLWSLFGQSIHAVLEKDLRVKPPKRMFAKLGKYTINGKFDRLDGGKLYDFKVTSIWTLIYNSRLEEWRDQLSGYRWLWWKSTGERLNPKGYIVAILRDWSRKGLERGSASYPQSPVVEIPLKLDGVEKTEKRLKERLELIERASGADIPAQCSKEDRWWNERTQRFMKCERFCLASAFCEQWKRTGNDYGKRI